MMPCVGQCAYKARHRPFPGMVSGWARHRLFPGMFSGRARVSFNFRDLVALCAFFILVTWPAETGSAVTHIHQMFEKCAPAEFFKALFIFVFKNQFKKYCSHHVVGVIWFEIILGLIGVLWGQVGVIQGHVMSSWGRLGSCEVVYGLIRVMWGQVAAVWGHVRSCWGQNGSFEAS